MGADRLDCNWCESARSIEHGICQVCLMEYPLDTEIIQMPLELEHKRVLLDRVVEKRVVDKRARRQKADAERIVIDLNESEIGLAE